MSLFIKTTNNLIKNNHISINTTTKYERIKKKTKEILLVSSAVGIPNVIKSEKLLIKIIWLILIAISTAIGSYYVIKSIIDYTNYITVTTVSILDEHESEFPTLTFCYYLPTSSNQKRIENKILRIQYDRIELKNYSNYFQEFEDPIYNKCFRFNSGLNINNEKVDVLKTSISGQKNGLKLEISLEIELDFFELIVNIHNRSTPPFDISNGGFWMKTGNFF
jgi:hypothetical protein